MPHAVKYLPNVLDVEQTSPLRVVMVYEDFEMAVQARKVCDLIVQEAGASVEVQLSVWRFDSFCSGDLRHAVSRRADLADVIVVAPRELDRLPAAVNAWLDQWSAHRHNGPGALVAVFHPAAAKATESNVALLLWRASARAGVDFFSGTPDWTARGLASVAEAHPASHLDFLPLAVTTDDNPHCSLGWGLDE